MNSQTAGNSVTVFPAELSAALCLFIRCFSPSASPQQQTCPARQRRPSICKGCIPPPRRFICRPVAHSRTVSEKSHLLHSTAAVSGQRRSAACTPTSRAPTGLFRKSQLIPSHLSPFCAHPWLCHAKKEVGEKRGTLLPHPPGETLKMISATLGVEILVNSTEN